MLLGEGKRECAKLKFRYGTKIDISVEFPFYTYPLLIEDALEFKTHPVFECGL
jgi:hypothetical protein